jgi:hypothetical protein
MLKLPYHETLLECLSLLGQEISPKGEDEHSSFNQILSIKAVHFLAFFILVYVGVEVTIGGTLFLSLSLSYDMAIVIYNNIIGWIVTFMLDVRDGGPSSGYISSGFFGGISIFLYPRNDRYANTNPRSHARSRPPALGKPKGIPISLLPLSSDSHFPSIQVGERLVLFLYTLLAIG